MIFAFSSVNCRNSAKPIRRWNHRE